MGLESAETVFAAETCLKELAMTNFRYRWLVLSAVRTAFVFSPLPPASFADDDVRPALGRQAEWTITIGSDQAEASESTGIVISPLSQIADGQASEKQEDPILVAPGLVAPADDEPSEEASATTEPAKRGAKKSEEAPMATETASEKAREEWQKKRPTEAQKRRTKNQASVEPKKGESKTSDKVKSEATEAKVSGKVSADDRSKAAVARAAAAKTKTASGQVRSSSVSQAVGVRDSRSYREIYNSIPFSRVEYDANPGYRHLATMEIMLGQLHPIIVAPPAPAPQESTREVTVRFLPSIRPGYRAWSRYPWH